MQYKYFIFCAFIFGNVYAEEGTTTIPQSELTITGQDRYFFEYKEELPEVKLSFPLMDLPKPKTIEKKEENLRLNIEEKERFIIKETPPPFVKERSLPLMKISVGNDNFLSSSILFAKEKKDKGLSLLVERERLTGFEYQMKKDFHSQNKDNAELLFGANFHEARITIPFCFFDSFVFLPYENRYEKRNRVYFELGYETPYYNNLRFSGSIFSEKKDEIKNKGMGTRLSFNFAKKNRLNLVVENEGNLVERSLLKTFLSFYPTKKQFKKKDILIQSDAGFSIFKNNKSRFFPELDISLKSQWRKDLILNLLLKNSLNSQSFSFLYFSFPYSTISTSLEPEMITYLKTGCHWKKQKLSLKNSLFLEGKKDVIEWHKKAQGLYEPRNSGSLFSCGIETEVNYPWTKKIEGEFSLVLMGLSKEINYTPHLKGEIRLEYRDGPLLISPKIVFKGIQKTDSSSLGSSFVLNIRGERRISDEFEVFFNIENLFNTRYMEREDYPAKRFFGSVGLKIRL